MVQQTAHRVLGRVKIVTLVAAVTLVTGCLGGGGSGGGESAPNLSDSPLFSKDRATPRSELNRDVSVMGGVVKIAAPKGFCIDTSSYQDTSSGAFVPLGACAALTKNAKDPKPETPAFLTASVLPMPAEVASLPEGPKARMQEARAFLQSDTGKAALSRSGKSDTVNILGMKSESDVLYVHLTDTSGGMPAALSNTTQRGFFEVNGMLVTASATAFSDTPLSASDGQKLLSGFVAAIRKASPNGPAQGGGLSGLLQRLRK